MSKLLILSGAGEPSYSSNKALTHAFRSLGHDVIFMGPGYFDRYEADILLPDIPYPELYSYDMVLEKSPWQPDLLLNISPHAFLTGIKPPEIKSCLYTTDPHREGEFIYRIAAQGSYNFLFLGQRHFMEPFYSLESKSITVEYLPVGFDERRFPEDAMRDDPVCSVVFVGQTGLSGLNFPNEDECGRYTTTTPELSIPQRYAFSGHPGYDYAERGELLYRLCKIFDVRIYDQVWETPKYCKALRKGALGFNCSLLQDISIRILESSAAGRLVVTDTVPGLAKLMAHHYIPYSLRWKPFFPNFNLDVQLICEQIEYWLNNDRGREVMAKNAKEHVWANHSWRCRAQELLGIVFG